VIAAQTPTTWGVSIEIGAVDELHRRSVDVVAQGPVQRTLRFWRPDATALVLGSTQSDSVVAPETKLPVVRRRTGGGAVLLAPGEQVWADVAIPAADPLWEADVGRAFWWLGEAWATALTNLGAPAAAVEVHREGHLATDWSDLVCFAGLGSGEVTLGGRKVVGISQRRTRHGALFQCAALLAWDPRPVLAALALSPEQRQRAESELSDRATAFPSTPVVLETAFAGALLASAR
jgi:lipoate-protein ligase A